MSLSKRFGFIFVCSVFLVLSFYLYTCSAEKSEFVDVDEFDDCFDRPELKTVEDYIFWFGSGSPDKSKFKPENFSKKEKAKYIDNGVKTLKENNDVYSCERLAFYYNEIKDKPKALYWALVGSEKGSGICMSFLRWSYSHGEGVVQDFEEAGKWCYLAAAKGIEDDIGLLKDLTNNESAKEFLKNCNDKANEWAKKHPEVFFDSN